MAFAVMLAKEFTYRDMEDFLVHLRGRGCTCERPDGVRMAKSDYWRRYLGFREAPDHSCYTDFLARVGPQFEAVFRDLVLQLAKRGVLRVGTAVPDSTVLHGYRSDGEAGWGVKETYRGREAKWGYKLHAVAAATSELPMALHVTPANVHDSRPFEELLEQVLGLDIRRVVADSAYDSRAIRVSLVNVGIQPVIQKNRRRNPGPGRPENKGARRYRKRTSVERMFSRVLDLMHLRRLRWRGVERVTQAVYVACIGMLLLAVEGRRRGVSPRAVRTVLRAI